MKNLKTRLLHKCIGFFSYSEITTLLLRFDRSDEKYFVGEEATIEAYLENPSAVRYLEWIRKTDIGNLAIDTTLSKFTRIGNETIKCFGLTINKCDESDAGTYLLLAACTKVNILSNEISLQVVEGKNTFYNLFKYFLILKWFVCLSHTLNMLKTFTKQISRTGILSYPLTPPPLI